MLYTNINPELWDELANLDFLGVSRCFPFWQEYLACYVINQNDPDARQKAVCAPALEDYYECLHHKKEVRLFQGSQS